MNLTFDTQLLGIVFDLDDTIYSERDYVDSGFRAVAELLASRTEVPISDWTERLTQARSDAAPGKVFDWLLDRHAELNGVTDITDLVRHYRDHRPTIEALPGMLPLLEGLRERGVLVGLITDGWWPGQLRKIEALGLPALVDTVITTDRWGQEHWKPGARSFRHLAATWKLAGERLAYIGDNPSKDFITPNRLGWRTVRLRYQDQLRSDWESPTPAHAASVELSSVAQLGSLLFDWTGTTDGTAAREAG